MRDPAHVWPAMLQQLLEAIGFESGFIAASWSTPTMGRGAIIGYDEPWIKRNHGRLLGAITAEELAGYVDRARRSRTSGRRIVAGRWRSSRRSWIPRALPK